ncbi:hypothetical protein [Actinokineospora bangkokensis]|uniref:PE domain-containing protein n=1 Tax=Actinokineospora bangkokensis TaxID=1193682 RepID=A0A1Q9LFB9_9PSEU|nr:hypothetical protein [Actinokineospora bangkokensis]OLR90710.1 hypothetical protein BJP25_29380 [Actinokineospora bangkokensis]
MTEHQGFSVDPEELERAARVALSVVDGVRAGWRGDRLDEDAWPADDELTAAVLRYRHALEQAAQRLCEHTRWYGDELGGTARGYRVVDDHVADELRRAGGRD